MAKIKTSFFCQSCGYQAPKFLGRCPTCGEWNSIVEEVVESQEPTKGDWRFTEKALHTKTKAKARPIHEIESQQTYRIPTEEAELDRVLGGGLVPGSITLIGGEPGIGKSTLMLQMALKMVDYTILYISGEESEQQIKMRADRISAINPKCYVYSETNTSAIFKQIEEIEPDILIIDSIQTMQSPLIDSGAGSVSQVKECAAEFLKFAKESDIPVLMLGHITKDGAIAGPKILEHMVDTVLQFEGDQHYTYRLLRTIKNRFGNTSELGIYEINAAGLREISDPSEILISNKDAAISGSGISAMMEGNRPLMIEIQSLVSTATYANPQRTSNGFDNKRLQMLLAVLEKRVGYKLATQDVFLNIAGGLKVEDPGIDLAVCAAIVSSFEEKPIHHKYAFAAEVGLGGEIRAVNRIESRVSEAEKLGFTKIFVSKYNTKTLTKSQIEIVACSKIEDVFIKMFL